MGHVNPRALATPEHGTGADASDSRRSTPESVAVEEMETTFYPRDLHGARQPPSISDPETWFRRGRERFMEEHKRLLTESFMRSRLHAREDGLFLFG